LLGGLVEQPDDHAEGDRRRHGTADALGEPGSDQHPGADRQPAHQRSKGEQDKAGQEHALAAEQITQTAAQQQQPAERDQVGVHDPAQAGRGETEVGLDRGQRDGHDRAVEDDHQGGRAQDDEREPAGAKHVTSPSRMNLSERP
jgi:hypothetical protein